MSKELTPLEAWEEVKDEMLEWTEGYEENFDVIETALKEYEMEHTLRIRLENINYELVKEKQENEKKLKALEIIKKRFTIQFIKSDFLPNYYGIMQIGTNPIYIKTQEEFDLLKEILKDE